jgi:hypothetical protein
MRDARVMGGVGQHMAKSSTVRVVAWIVTLANVGAFHLSARDLTASVSSIELVIATLPYLVACAAMLVLFWVGPFPSSWPRVGGRKGGVTFWGALVLLCMFWAYFYCKFVFGL